MHTSHQDNISMKNNVTFLIVAFLTIYLFGGINCAFGKTSVKNVDLQALKFHDKLMFDDVVEIYKKYDWSTKGSPYSIMVLCSALVEIDSDVDIFFKGKKEDSHIYYFAKAYTDLLNGKVVKAKDQFMKLQQSNNIDEVNYGVIGLLEASIFTQDYKSLKLLLGELNNISLKDENIHESLKYYSLLHSSLTNDFETASKILKKLDLEAVENDLTIKIVTIEIKIRGNKLSTALEMTNDALSHFGTFQDLLLLKSRILSLQNGEAAEAAFLERS